MRSIVQSLLLAMAVLGGVGAFPAGETSAMACPNCKAANETDSLKPKAYMYSILFMIGMPATIFTGFSLSFWRMARKAHLEQEVVSAEETVSGPGAE